MEEEVGRNWETQAGGQRVAFSGKSLKSPFCQPRSDSRLVRRIGMGIWYSDEVTRPLSSFPLVAHARQLSSDRSRASNSPRCLSSSRRINICDNDQAADRGSARGKGRDRNGPCPRPPAYFRPNNLTSDSVLIMNLV